MFEVKIVHRDSVWDLISAEAQRLYGMLQLFFMVLISSHPTDRLPSTMCRADQETTIADACGRRHGVRSMPSSTHLQPVVLVSKGGAPTFVFCCFQ